MFSRHIAPLHVVEREIVVVVNCKNGHRRSKARKCRTRLLLGIHAADCVEVARVCVDVVAEEHHGVGAGVRCDAVEQSVAVAQALHGRRKGVERDVVIFAKQKRRDL